MASNVPLTDLQSQVPIRTKGNTKCAVHRKKDVILHCADCCILICLSCSISTHNGHTLTEISDKAQQKKDILKNIIHDIENNKLIQLRSEIQSIETEINENDTNFKDLGQQVKKQGEVCKKQIDDLTDEFVSTCDSLERENRKLLLKYKDELQQRYTSLLGQVKECKEVLQNGTDVLVYDSEFNLSAEDIPESPVLHKADFQPCTLITDQLREALGMLNVSSGPSNTSSENIQSRAFAEGLTLQEEFLDEPVVLTKFKSPVDCTSVCPNTSGAWLCDDDSALLMLVDTKGRIIRRVKFLESNIMDISISHEGHLWFCCRENFSINEVAASSTVPITRFEADTWPTCIATTKDGKVIVGTRNQADPEGKLFLYTTEGQSILSTASNKKGSELETPYSISECSITGNFAVNSGNQESDTEYWSGRVIVYDKELKFKFDICEDVSEGKTAKSSFYPRGAVYDSKGHLLIGSDDKVLVLNGTGQFLHTLHIQENSTIVAIGVQPDDILWVHLYAQRLEKRGMFGKLLKKRSDSSASKSEIKTLKYYKD